MSRFWSIGFALLFFLGAVFSIPPTSGAYLAKPLPAHTGAFGEPSCQKCHWEAPLNDAGGTLTVKGLPAEYSAEESYRLTVTVERPGLRRAGFQLTARFRDGEAAGRQAGVLSAVDERVLIQTAEGVQYAGHSESGTGAADSGSLSWIVEWSPPEIDQGPVVFHAAANASNDDASELGDFIYLSSVELARILNEANVKARSRFPLSQ